MSGCPAQLVNPCTVVLSGTVAVNPNGMFCSSAVTSVNNLDDEPVWMPWPPP